MEYLLQSQNADGGWGGAKGVVSSVEETALAVAALAPWSPAAEIRTALFRGVEYLIGRVARAAARSHRAILRPFVVFGGTLYADLGAGRLGPRGEMCAIKHDGPCQWPDTSVRHKQGRTLAGTRLH